MKKERPTDNRYNVKAKFGEVLFQLTICLLLISVTFDAHQKKGIGRHQIEIH